MPGSRGNPTAGLIVIPPATFDEIHRSCRHYEQKVEGKLSELGIAARHVMNLVREVREHIKKIEAQAKQGDGILYSDVLHEYMDIFSDEDTLWETLDLAHDPSERIEFTRRSVLTPKVLYAALSSFRQRVVTLTAERDAFRARRARDIAHFEAAVGEMHLLQQERLQDTALERLNAEAAADERFRAALGKIEALQVALGAMRTRAERTEVQLRLEREARLNDCELFAAKERAWEHERASLLEAISRADAGRHLAQIATVHKHVEKALAAS